MNDPIILMEYQEDWAELYGYEKVIWSEILHREEHKIHHIGSTAIRHIQSKPIIDILIEVNQIQCFDSLEKTITDAGYLVKGEYGISGRRFFQKLEHGIRKVHVHCFESNNPQVNNHILFCNILKNSQTLAKEYESIKLELAKKYTQNRIAYSEGKNEFIQKVLKHVNSG